MADAADDEAPYAQAVRFLTSLRSQKNQDIVAQKSFLQSKGLSEEVIARAFHDVKPPDSIAEEAASQAAGVIGGDSNNEAFERAAEMFDQPLQSEAETTSSLSPPPTAPPKTYPRSPLALYHQPQPGQALKDDFSAANPLTRYDVLLGFFRSMCYLLVLGGGVTGMVVALYRTYLIPRIVSTLDARSFLLKHHSEQYNLLANKIKTLRGNSLSPNSHLAMTAPLKGVLKKVQFADDISGEKQIFEEEGKKEAGEKETSQEKKMDVEKIPQSDVESDEESKSSEPNDKINIVKSVDVLEPIRSSLSRLGQSLKADMSATAIGTDIIPTAATEETSTPKRLTSTTVEEESDADSWISEEDSDELEFDPYSPSSSRNSKRKHNPANVGKSTSATLATGNASSTTAISLNSSLSTLNAYINSQTYMASANIYGGGRSMGLGSLGGGGGSASSGSEKEGSKAGDVAQIRADIRNLKGLLLSRRNFPTYRTPAQVSATAGN